MHFPVFLAHCSALGSLCFKLGIKLFTFYRFRNKHSANAINKHKFSLAEHVRIDRKTICEIGFAMRISSELIFKTITRSESFRLLAALSSRAEKHSLQFPNVEIFHSFRVRPPAPAPGRSLSLSAFFIRSSVLAISIFICSSTFRQNGLNGEHVAKNILYFIEVVCKAVAPADEKAERTEESSLPTGRTQRSVCVQYSSLIFRIKIASGRVLKLGELMRRRSASRTSNNFPFTHKSTRRSCAVVDRRTGRARLAFKCSALRSGPK